MALATALVNNGLWATKRAFRVLTLTPSGNYTTGGDTLDLSSDPGIGSDPPLIVLIVGQGLFLYTYIPGTNMTNGKLKVISLATQAEIPGAPTAYPAGVTGDIITALVISEQLM